MFITACAFLICFRVLYFVSVVWYIDVQNYQVVPFHVRIVTQRNACCKHFLALNAMLSMRHETSNLLRRVLFNLLEPTKSLL